jgi:undecaprenyl-diphosphatase
MTPPLTPAAAAAGASTGQALAWANRRNTIRLVAGILMLRVIYLVWLCPYQLIEDEAHYWEWSRHPALSYYTKGPGVAWAIAGATALCGAREWGIRLPAALAGALAAFVAARLAVRFSGGDERAGFFTAALFSLVPLYYGAAQFMTIDAPYLACWICAAACAWGIVERAQRNAATLGLWLLLGLCLGLGFLFKYTILLLLPGLLVFAWLERRSLRPDRWTALRIALGCAVFAAAISPVVVWNQRHGWPTAAHLLGHLGVRGGDMPLPAHWRYEPQWTLEFIGSQIGILGPFGCALLWLAWRRTRSGTRDPSAAPTVYRFACWSAVPILAFYVLLSLHNDVEGNWPMAGYSVWIALAGVALSAGLVAARQPAANAEDRRRARALRIAWRGFLATGALLPALFLLPPAWFSGARWRLIRTPVRRVSGHREQAALVQHAIEALRARTRREPLVIAASYGKASLLAYYLPGRPTVYSAASYLGGRRSAYDYFRDTNLADPGLHHRPAVLFGGAEVLWRRSFIFDALRPWPQNPPLYLATDYHGPRLDWELYDRR